MKDMAGVSDVLCLVKSDVQVCGFGKMERFSMTKERKDR